MIELYEVVGGYGVKILTDTISIDQPIHPYWGRPMTFEEAQDFGEAMLNGLPVPFELPPPPPEPEPQPPTAEQQRIADLEAQLAQTNTDMAAFMDFVFTEIVGEPVA